MVDKKLLALKKGVYGVKFVANQSLRFVMAHDRSRAMEFYERYLQDFRRLLEDMIAGKTDVFAGILVPDEAAVLIATMDALLLGETPPEEDIQQLVDTLEKVASKFRNEYHPHMTITPL